MGVHANFCNFSIYLFRYINSKDVKRIVKMLGFRATKDVFDEMISMYNSFHFL
jgi:Ca2+-binding EF-hand superfamily protein